MCRKGSPDGGGVTLRDGTAMAHERIGQGQTLLVVNGVLCSGKFRPLPKLAPFRAEDFTVILY